MEDGIYVHEGAKSKLYLKRTGITYICAILNNILFIDKESIGICTNAYCYHEYASHMNNLFQLIETNLNNLPFDELNNIVLYFKGNENFITSRIGNSAINGTNGYPARVSIESLSNINRNLSSIVDTIKYFDADLDIPFKRFTTVKLENFFSTLWDDADHNPMYITALRRLRSSVRNNCIRFHINNKKPLCEGTIVGFHQSVKRERPDLDSDEQLHLKKAMKVIGRSYSCSPTLHYKDHCGSIPSSFFFYKKLESKELEKSSLDD